MRPTAVRFHRILMVVLLAAGCGQPARPAPEAADRPQSPLLPPSATVPGAIRFREQQLPFQYDRGESGRALPVEPTGGGVGLLDADGDGDLDIFFAQGVSLDPSAHDPVAHDVLLRNDTGGQFTDVSAQAGLLPRGYGMGLTVADYDADGDPDVYVTRYGANTLWRNDGGVFSDQTAAAGVGCDRWSVGAAFADYDRDGDLDLYVANYFTFDPARAPFLRDPKTGNAMFGAPADFPGQTDTLYRNEGDGRFTDVSQQAGIADHSRGMGVLACDIDGDQLIDFLVANDAEPNILWRNRGDGTFEDVATSIGLAVNGSGMAEANMGIAHGDTNRDGRLDLLMTHFYDEHDTLWRAEPLAAGSLFYRDSTFEAGLAAGSRPLTGWGTALADFDQDGWLDLIVTTGHIRPEPQQRYRYKSPPLLWKGGTGGHFSDARAQAGPYFTREEMGRGLAVGDLDGDLDLDAVIVHHNAPASLLWNESSSPGHALVIELQGRPPNRDAIAAHVTARVGSRTYVDWVVGGGSYASSNAQRLHLGIGDAQTADSIEVRWPLGPVERRERVPADQLIRWQEPASSAGSVAVPEKAR